MVERAISPELVGGGILTLINSAISSVIRTGCLRALIWRMRGRGEEPDSMQTENEGAFLRSNKHS